MSSWLTVKDDFDSLQAERGNVEIEPTKELGIFKLRLTYTKGLNALQCSEEIGDENWSESRICFEDVIHSADVSAGEAGAARSECALLIFLSNSNLSRMLMKSDEKALALNYALDAVSTMSIEDSSVHDPGLLLRIAKLTLELRDSWSCRQLLNFRIRHDRRAYGDNVGGLLDSFYQLRNDLLHEVASSSSSFKSQVSQSTREKSFVLLDASTLNSDSCEFTNALAAVLASEAARKSFNYSFLVSYPGLKALRTNTQERSGSGSGSVEILQPTGGSDNTIIVDKIVDNLGQESENICDDNPRDETISSAASGRKSITEPRKARSALSSDTTAQSDNIGSSLSRRRKESLNVSSSSSTRFTNLQVRFVRREGSRRAQACRAAG